MQTKHSKYYPKEGPLFFNRKTLSVELRMQITQPLVFFQEEPVVTLNWLPIASKQ